MDAIEIKADLKPYDRGYAIGMYWAEYFVNFSKFKDGMPKINRRYLENEYIQYIESNSKQRSQINKSPVRKYFDVLLKSKSISLLNFIFDEIEGMIAGFNENCDSLYYLNEDVAFDYCLGELSIHGGSKCSSFVLKFDQGYILAHNEEWDSGQIDPFLIVKNSDFVSISYPFQLLGSGGGYNNHFAFQGNSIGTYNKRCKTLTALFEKIPKTFYSRWLLGVKSNNYLSEVKIFLNEYKIALPSHNYIVSNSNAHSVSVIPDGGCTFMQIAVDNFDFHVHTNHFLNNISNDQWKGDQKWMKDSNRRYRWLKAKLKKEIASDFGNSDLSSMAKKVMVNLITRENPGMQFFESSTSGTFIYTITDAIQFSACLYFPELQIPGFPWAAPCL